METNERIEWKQVKYGAQGLLYVEQNSKVLAIPNLISM